MTAENAQAAQVIDAAMQRWRRSVARHDLTRRALTDLGIRLDIAQFDILAAIEGAPGEFGRQDDREPMVAMLAARLGIDPSRASRLVGELVAKGFAARVPSASDRRRMPIALTAAGLAVVAAVRDYRQLALAHFLASAEPGEAPALAGLIERLVAFCQRPELDDPDLGGEIAALAEDVRDKVG